MSTLEAAIAGVTRALATAAGDVIPELVAERAELRALREEAAGVVRLERGRERR